MFVTLSKRSLQSEVSERSREAACPEQAERAEGVAFFDDATIACLARFLQERRRANIRQAAEKLDPRWARPDG